MPGVATAYRSRIDDRPAATCRIVEHDLTRQYGGRSVVDIHQCVSVYLPFMVAYRDEGGWGALGDPTRRTIVLQLAQRPQAVVELAATLPISRPAVSQHLRVLKEAGLVTERAAGTRRIYQLNEAGLTALRDQLDTFWDRALAGYQDVIDDSTKENT